jgi:hypothetical protein
VEVQSAIPLRAPGVRYVTVMVYNASEFIILGMGSPAQMAHPSPAQKSFVCAWNLDPMSSPSRDGLCLTYGCIKEEA